MEEEENLGAGGFTSAPNVGGEGTSASQPSTGKLFAFHLYFFLFFLNLGLGFASSPSRYPDPPSADPEDIDTVIEDVAKDIAAEAEKIPTEEAAKGAAEDAAKGPAGEPGKGPAEEAGKAAVEEADKAAVEEEVADDQPSASAASGSGRYLRVGEDLFVHLPGTASTGAPVEGEVFDDEVLAAAGLEVVDEPSAGGGGS